ncbi:enediyne biosynthesis protein [Crossiella cryophila]|uniref:Enediyne biosynthesis protein UnbU n=1 Tax=Crossiella cryophila TaxID=43355 RepID=A0A7W7FX16_9PSEU|nr:enediyne biosynthesis protein [Crossiella cryophila]MBB4678459.1 hypothetical protein [Crossiella cryophila]
MSTPRDRDSIPPLRRHLLTIASIIPPPDKRISALRRFATSITIFTILGYLWLGFEASAAQIAVLLGTAYALELSLESLEAWANGFRPRFLGGGVIGFVNFMLPTHITALSLGLLIYAGNLLWPYAFASALAIGSKYILRVRISGKLRHFLNPSNLAIAVALTVFPTVIGPAPMYHFTAHVSGVLDWIIPLILVAFGTLLNVKLTRKGPLIAAWLLGMAAQAVLRGLLFPEENSILSGLGLMTGTAFLLFTNYMITDPGTSPTGKWQQVAFGLGSAAVYGVLVSSGVVFGLFYCIAIVCAIRGAYHWTLDLSARSKAKASEPLVAAEAPSRNGRTSTGVLEKTDA